MDRYQSALLMPAWLIREGPGPLRLHPLGRPLRPEGRGPGKHLEPVVRLQRLKLIYIPEGAKTIYRSEDEFRGQRRLF